MRTKPPLTQAEIDALILKTKEELVEAEAKRRLQSKNEAFDHFVNSGEIIPEPEYFERFITIEQLRNAMPLPDIDMDPPMLIIDYPQILRPAKPISQETIIIFDKLIEELSKKYKLKP